MRLSHLLYVLILAGVAYGQETRASITGLLTDPSGAAIAGAGVAARNTDTNLTVRATSAPDGAYTLPKLPAGRYTLSAQARGFRKFVRTGITLAVADNARVDFQLTIGAVSDSVTVTTELAGVETSQTVMGQLVSNRAVNELPLNGRSFLTLLQLTAGVIFTPSVGNQGWGGTRPWEAGPAADAFLVQGGRPGTNAFMVDGGMMGTKGGANWIPLTDSIDEIKVSTPTSDASLGLSGGGVINLTLKSGGNEFHGVASHFLRNSRTDSLTTQVRRINGVRTQHQWNSFSYMLGGPIIRNKWFFNGGYDGFREMTPYGTGVNTVPTELQRTGDFSQTFNSQGQMVLIYDPSTTRQEGSRFVRTPFAGNRLPATRVATLARNYAAFFPLPNSAGDAFTASRNYIKPTPMFIGTDAWHVKSEYNWNSSHRTNATVSQSWGIVWGNDQGLERNSPAAQSRSPQGRVHASTVVDHTWTASPTTVVTGRLTWDRFVEYNGSTPSLQYDGSKLGYETPVSPYGTHFPAVTIAGMMGLGGPNRRFVPHNDYFGVLDTFRVIGRHNLKFGGGITEARHNQLILSNYLGAFSFTTGFTQANPQLVEPSSGYAFASFILGYPGGGSVGWQDTSATVSRIYSAYIQDDYRISQKLTLNIGLRWDAQLPAVERYNRMVRTFDPKASYTLNGVPVSGGLLFADPDHRTRFAGHYRDFQPRLGLAWNVRGNTVIQASYGLSFLPNNTQYGDTVDQTGYSRTTPFLATLGAGLTAYVPNLPGTGTWARPFPDGILPPTGNGAGLKTNVGAGVRYISPDYVVPRVHQFNLGLKHELPWKTTLEMAYVGSRTRKLPVSKSLNYAPLEQYLKSLGDPNYWNQKATNPFYGAPELVGSSFNTATLGIGALMTRYPQFNQVTMDGLPLGSSSYNAGEIRVNKRMSQGLMLSASYTYSKLMTATAFRHNWAAEVFRQADNQDRPHHFTMALLLELPVGRGRLLGANWHGVLNGLLGGWQYNASVEKASGSPVGMPGISLSDPLQPAPGDGRHFQTCTQLLNGTRFNCASPGEPAYWRQDNYNEIAAYSTLWSRVRVPTRASWNMSMMKKVPLYRERVHVEFRTEFFNAFNTPQYGGPVTTLTDQFFGRVQEDQWNFARNIQFAARILF